MFEIKLLKLLLHIFPIPNFDGNFKDRMVLYQNTQVELEMLLTHKNEDGETLSEIARRHENFEVAADIAVFLSPAFKTALQMQL